MSASTASLVAPLCVAVPLIAAALLMPLSKVMPRWLSCTIASLAALAVLGMCLSLLVYSAAHGTVVHWMGGWTPHHTLAIGINFAVDPIGAGLAAFVALLVFAATMYTWMDFDIVGTLFHALMMSFLAAMCGYALTGDLFNMFVWFELMTAAAIALTAHKIEEAESIEGAINLAVTNTIAGFMVLLGIALVYARTDALNLAQLEVLLAQRSADALVVTSFALIVCGYFVKGAVAPFHFWLDDAHAVAPTPICVLFSGVMVQLALYGVARVYWTAFAGALAPHTNHVRALFIGVGIATALLGAVMAFAQRHLKRLLAFSTVSHSGIFVAAIGLFNVAGAAACALYILAHGLVKSALFLSAGNFLNRFRSLDEEVLGGKGRAARVNCALFLVGGLALVGMPPFAIAPAKALYDAALNQQNLLAVVIVMAFASIVDAGAVLRSGIHITWGIGKAQHTGSSPREEETECEEERLSHTPWPAFAAPVLLLAVAIWMGTDAHVWEAIQRGVAPLADNKAYAASVLGGARPMVGNVRYEHVGGEHFRLSAGLTLAAILTAFIGLFRERIPPILNVMFGTPLRLLRTLHSGIFTDYVAYIVFGIAAYTVWLVLAVP